MWIVFNNSFTFAFTEELQKAVINSTTLPQICWKIWMFNCVTLQQSYSIQKRCKIVVLVHMST